MACLAAFWLLSTVEALLDAPRWFWFALRPVVGIAAALLLFGWGGWYLGFAVAGAAALLQRVDDLLFARGDEIVANLTRRFGSRR